MVEDRKITLFDNEEAIELYVLEETRLNGVSYLLAADTPDEEAEGSCYILKDMSGREETEALYEFVEDEDDLEGLMKIFDELLEDVDIERE